jgi:hypothetical protein
VFIIGEDYCVFAQNYIMFSYLFLSFIYQLMSQFNYNNNNNIFFFHFPKIGFGVDLSFVYRVVDGIVNILFGIDILITFNTAIEDRDGDLIYDRKEVSMSYLKGWFGIDLISTIPFVELFTIMHLGKEITLG